MRYSDIYFHKIVKYKKEERKSSMAVSNGVVWRIQLVLTDLTLDEVSLWSGCPLCCWLT